MSFKLEEWEELEQVNIPGNGQGGAMNEGVFNVSNKRTGLVAIKKVVPVDENHPRHMNEMTILKDLTSLNSPYINQYIGHHEYRGPRKDKKGKIYDCKFVDLYIKKADLLGLDRLLKQYNIRDPIPLVPEAFLWHVFISTTRALVLLHFRQNDINVDPDQSTEYTVHSDIKLGNILLTKRKNFRHNHPYPAVILGDFGGAITAEQQDQDWDKKLISFGGGYTPMYSPPDIEKTGVSPAMDIYCLGMSMAHMMGVLIPGKKDKDAGVIDEKALKKLNYSKRIKECMQYACIGVIAKRPNAQMLLKRLCHSRRMLVNEGVITHMRDTAPLPAWALPAPKDLPKGTIQPPQFQGDPRLGGAAPNQAKLRQQLEREEKQANPGGLLAASNAHANGHRSNVNSGRNGPSQAPKSGTAAPSGLGAAYKTTRKRHPAL